MSYGVEQETAAAALTALVIDESAPWGYDPNTLLGMREQLRLAILERLHIVGSGPNENTAAKPHLDAMAHQGVHLLHRIIREAPHDQPGWAKDSPADLLAQRPDDPTLAAYACAARAVTIGNHELTAALDPVWSHRPAANWHLLADAAEVVEAFVVLDHRLEQVGLLGSLDQPDTSWTVRGRRAIAATVAREAAWAGVDDSPDRATSAASIRGGDAVQLVRDPDTMALAQLRLADFVRPRGEQDHGFDPTQELSLSTGRALVLSQAKVNRELAAACAGLPDLAEVAARFQRRSAQLIEIRQKSVRFRDLADIPTPMRIFSQQIEITRGSQLIGTALRTADPVMMTNLDAAARAASVEVARALRLQTIRKNSPYGQYIDTREARVGADVHHSFPAACEALIATEAPLARWCAPVSRGALRDALRAAPSPLRGTASRMDHSHHRARDLDR